MRRSRWKIPFVSLIFFDKKIFKSNHIKVNHRNSTITKAFFKKRISLHSGQVWKTVYPRFVMLGHKLGVYCFTKIFGRAIGQSMALKALRKKEDKKKK